MSQPDGGPVLPIPSYNNIYVGDNRDRIGPGMGLSLRDWFAGMALQGIVADPATNRRIRCGGWSEDRIATYAFQLASAMLKQREAQP